jgi:serine-type D-Ala-D-Ala endopeptidase (penicillin-binding protein 7)
MRSATKRKFSLPILLASLLAIGVLAPLTYKAWQQRQAGQQSSTVAVAPVPGSAPAPAAPAAPEAETLPPSPPGTEVVPPEESETDRGAASASPAGPTLSFGRAAGLHLTPDPLRLSSSAALVVDRASGEVLVHKNDQAVLPIASLTKLMTSLVVLDANQPMDEVLTITEEDVDNERHSRSRLKVGTKLTRQEALRLALMSSENRAAHALGRSYPGGLDKMVAAMNAKARQLGMKNSAFVDPTGLSNANKATARDVAVLVRTAAQNPLIAQYSTTPQHLADLGGRTLQYINSNRLVRNEKSGWDIALQKTGYIVEAGRCLTMVADVAGREVILVLLDAESNGARLADAQRLRRWAVAQWGGPAAVAALDAEKAAPRKVAAAKRKDPGDKRKVVAAKKKSAEKKTTVAKKSGSRKTATAAKAEAGKDGRVRQTFAAGKDDSKS